MFQLLAYEEAVSWPVYVVLLAVGYALTWRSARYRLPCSPVCARTARVVLRHRLWL
jgi:hypothetical protein